MLRSRLGRDAPGPIEAFRDHGADVVVADTLAELVAGMNRLTDEPLLRHGEIGLQIRQCDAELDHRFSKDQQVIGIHNARCYLGDRLTRVVKPHKILDPAYGPLIGVRLHVLTRKTLGGIQTDLDGRGLDGVGAAIPGLYAAGEVAGFGGGGTHGYNASEHTFLGGCVVTRRTVGRAPADQL